MRRTAGMMLLRNEIETFHSISRNHVGLFRMTTNSLSTFIELLQFRFVCCSLWLHKCKCHIVFGIVWICLWSCVFQSSDCRKNVACSISVLFVHTPEISTVDQTETSTLCSFAFAIPQKRVPSSCSSQMSSRYGICAEGKNALRKRRRRSDVLSTWRSLPECWDLHRVMQRSSRI